MANPSTYDEIVGIRLALNNLGGLLASQPIGAMLDIDAIRAIAGQLPSGYAVAVLFSGAAGGVVANGQLVGGYYVSSNGNIEPFAGGAVALGMAIPSVVPVSIEMQLHVVKGPFENFQGVSTSVEFNAGVMGMGFSQSLSTIIDGTGANSAQQALGAALQFNGALSLSPDSFTDFATILSEAPVGSSAYVMQSSQPAIATAITYLSPIDFEFRPFMAPTENELLALSAAFRQQSSHQDLSDFSSLANFDFSGFSGTGLETFIPSAFWPGNTDWDWSTLSFSQPTLPFHVQDGNFEYFSVPGISVVDATGNFTGTFAQTSDGIPIFQIAADSYGITQTAFPTEGGGVRVITNNGSFTGLFDFSGPVGTTADPFTYFGNTANLQLQDLKFTDNSTSEVVGQGKYIKGGNTKTGGDAIVAQVRSATTGAWQTTVTVNRPEPGLTPEQQEALIRQAIADIIAGDGLVVDADGAIAHVTGTLLRATDAGSDATWIEPDAIDAGGVLMRTAPVLGWRTYNFTVDGLHTYVAANDNTSPEVSRAA